MNSRHRLRFSKAGTARYISHLDLMRTFQRAFLRAGVPIRHTEGFNPHAFVSIALPLPVGQSSVCELLDCELMGDIPLEEVPERLNRALPEGIAVLRAYEAVRSLKELCWLRSEVRLEYDRGVPAGAAEEIAALFARPSLTIEKKTKRREKAEIDMIPMIQSVEVEAGEEAVLLRAVTAAQNPSLNPELLAAALRFYLPELAPDFTAVRRTAVLDRELEKFE